MLEKFLVVITPLVTNFFFIFPLHPVKYRVFSIRRWGRLFKTRPRRLGVYLNPAFAIIGYFSSVSVYSLNFRS